MKNTKKQQSELCALQSHLGFWLRLISNNVSSSFTKKLAYVDITPAEWVILREMYDKHTLAPSLVADMTGLTRGAVSKLVERLVQKGYAQRSSSSTDRRYQDICLSEKGREIVPTLAALADENDNEFFSVLTQDEQEKLMSILQKISVSKKLTAFPIN